ncbi:putative pyridoxal phosphate biosynthetic protein PdxJ [Burkholderia cepacia]|uniref:Pyridoxal phosphate biosynthetic protein PdxJ n=1 Tax=Burkholderia cepacia TaxID=292 RepID=A0AAE8NMZ5_BURCE|nr:hypothetical protein [Burkholderia cepacia]POM20651.1 hypothetical protein CSX04_02067 [Burkholderia cepacia]SQA62011.1 putative pyridoxal phosphate biosynthetic protein PdxJ [Burkholderia cepacia]
MNPSKSIPSHSHSSLHWQLSKAAEAGKTKVTKKYLEAAPLLDTHPDPEPSPEHTAPAAVDVAPLVAATAADATIETHAPMQAASRQSAPTKISEKQSKQLLQALQSVLHDSGFGKLSQTTIDVVHAALMPIADLLDSKPAGKKWPVSVPDNNGVCRPADKLVGPARTGRIAGPLAYIFVAQPAQGIWISSFEFNTGTSYSSNLLQVSRQAKTAWTRTQAIHDGAASLIDAVTQRNQARTKTEGEAYRKIAAWAKAILETADPDWTREFATATAKGQRPDLTDVLADLENQIRQASNRALLDAAFPTQKTKPGLDPASAWPFPRGVAN